MVGTIISTALTGLIGAGKQAEAAASNIVNADVVGSTDQNEQQAYTPIDTQSTSLSNINGNGAGIRTEFVNRDPAFVPSFQPDSPFANTDGLVNAPNVNLGQELVSLTEAEFSYKANAQLIKTEAELFDELLAAVDTKA